MPVMSSMPVTLPPVMPTLLPENDKAARAAELQARIQSKLATVGLSGPTSTAQTGYSLFSLFLTLFPPYLILIN